MSGLRVDCFVERAEIVKGEYFFENFNNKSVMITFTGDDEDDIITDMSKKKNDCYEWNQTISIQTTKAEITSMLLKVMLLEGYYTKKCVALAEFSLAPLLSGSPLKLRVPLLFPYAEFHAINLYCTFALK